MLACTAALRFLLNLSNQIIYTALLISVSDRNDPLLPARMLQRVSLHDPGRILSDGCNVSHYLRIPDIYPNHLAWRLR